MKEKNNSNIGVWFAKAKNGMLLTFTSEPKRKGDSWEGNFYVNSIIYENIKNMLNGTSYSWKDEPQYLEFKLTVAP